MADVAEAPTLLHALQDAALSLNGSTQLDGAGRRKLTKSQYREWATNGQPGLHEVLLTFGCWADACDAAGLAIPKGPRNHITAEDLRDSLERASAHLGSEWTQESYDRWAMEHNGVRLATIRRLYGSFTDACHAVGVAPRRVRRVEAGDQCEEALQTVAKRIGKAPSVRAYDQWRPRNAPSGRRILKQYGTWALALTAAGLSVPKESQSKAMKLSA